MGQSGHLQKRCSDGQNKKIRSSKPCLESAKRQRLMFPTLMCWHLILEKISPLTSHTVLTRSRHSLNTGDSDPNRPPQTDWGHIPMQLSPTLRVRCIHSLIYWLYNFLNIRNFCVHDGHYNVHVVFQLIWYSKQWIYYTALPLLTTAFHYHGK